MNPGLVANDHRPTRTLSSLSLVWGLLLCSLLALTTGCETLNARLARNQALFGSLAPEHQELIRQGQIQVGFAPDEVYLAWGAPSRKALTENARGKIETWYYTAIHTETYYWSDPFYYDNWGYGGWRRYDYPVYRYREYLLKEAIFTNGKLSSYTVHPSYEPFVNEPPPRY